MKDNWDHISEEDSKYEIARLVARWILAGRPNIEKQEVQDWLLENGYSAYGEFRGIEDAKEEDKKDS